MVSTHTSRAGNWGSTPSGVMCRFCSTKVTFSKERTPYALLKLLLKKNERYTLYRSYCSKKPNAIRCIEVTVRKNWTLYTVSKVLFEKNERYTLYQSYFSKKPNAIRCIEATFQSNCAQLCVPVYIEAASLPISISWFLQKTILIIVF